MEMAVIEIRGVELTVPRTLSEYLDRVRQDNQWYFSHDAIVFRLWETQKIWLKGQVDEEDLLKCIDFSLRQEERAHKGVPERLAHRD